MANRCSLHVVRSGFQACTASREHTVRVTRHAQRRHISSQSSGEHGYSSDRIRLRIWGVVFALGAGAAFFHGTRRLGLRDVYAEAPPAPVEIKIEKSKKKKGLTKEDNRDLISSQHLQVKRSWENPGVYAWGSNSGRVVAPDSEDNIIKSARRISYFDGVLLRDMKLDRDFGAAITEKGDLLQWGIAYSKDTRQPTPTLTGKDLISVAVSKDRVIALGSNGTVYSLPVSQEDQASGPKPSETSWIPLWSSKSPVSYRLIEPKLTSWSEKVTSISSGLEHLLLLTSAGRLFSAASSSTAFPTRGQLGISGLTWTTRPEGPYDQPHEITTLRGFEITKIATGDNHSLAVDKEARVFSFGDNTSGQLGFDYNSESPYVDVPSLLPIQKLYAGTSQTPRVTSVAAGGANSFFTIDATRVARPNETADTRGLGKVSADTWASGSGILGSLGNGRWTHVQGTPAKIKPLSGLFEYDETAKTVVSIRLARISVGATHACAVMDNVTHVGATQHSSENDTNWGADVVWWGGNEHFQLGTGKRNNRNEPGYMPPLDVAADREKGRREEHRFQSTPRKRVKVNGRWVEMEQRVECGRFVSAVYSGV